MKIVISDVHLLNPEVPSEHIIESIEEFITPDMWARATGLFFPGDLIDRLISAEAFIDKYDCVLDGFENLLRNSKRFNVPIRIVKGTPFHDWNLVKWLLKVNKLTGINADIRYFDDVHLEYDDVLKLWMAYIPDAIRSTPEQVYDELVEKMKTLGCSKIHYILAHGYFDFQNTHDSPAYDTAKFSDLVEYAIFCGHDHGNKSFMKVHVPGSFERLRYGEEHPKGGLISQVIGNTHRVIFKENKRAANIRTVDFTGMDDETLMTRVNEEISKQMQGTTSYLGKLRVLVNGNTLVRKALERLSRKTVFKLDFEFVKDESEKIEKRERNQKFTENLVPMTANSIEDLLLAGISCDETIAKRIIQKIQGAVK